MSSNTGISKFNDVVRLSVCPYVSLSDVNILVKFAFQFEISLAIWPYYYEDSRADQNFHVVKVWYTLYIVLATKIDMQY